MMAFVSTLTNIPLIALRRSRDSDLATSTANRHSGESDRGGLDREHHLRL